MRGGPLDLIACQFTLRLACSLLLFLVHIDLSVMLAPVTAVTLVHLSDLKKYWHLRFRIVCLGLLCPDPYWLSLHIPVVTL